MREKYFNLNTFEIEAMTPADMLNITYEYNKKQSIIQEKEEKFQLKSSIDQKNSGSKQSSKMQMLMESMNEKLVSNKMSSSSSSSQENIAAFNILEEMQYN